MSRFARQVHRGALDGASCKITFVDRSCPASHHIKNTAHFRLFMFVINTLLPRGVCVSLCERVGVPNTGATPRPRRDGTMRRAGGKANRTSPGAHPCMQALRKPFHSAGLTLSLSRDALLLSDRQRIIRARHHDPAAAPAQLLAELSVTACSFSARASCVRVRLAR